MLSTTQETMVKRRDVERECLIFESVASTAKKVLDQNMSVSTALPCRISIYDEGGKAILATLSQPLSWRCSIRTT